MEIRRSGARHFEGWDELVDNRVPSLQWDTADDSAVLGVRRVPSVHNPDALYDYEVRLSVTDIALIVTTLSEQGIQNAPADVRAALRSIAIHLVRCLGCAAGLIPPTEGTAH
jgi:hypothetical protein